MRLRLTYERAGGRPAVDLLITVDPGTPVGALAEHLIRSDPSPALDPAKEYVLAFDSMPTELTPETTVADSGLVSGRTVSIEPSDDHRGSRSTRVAAELEVVSGPDAGRSFALGTGVSTIGRGRDCEVRLKDPMLSRRHAKLVVADTIKITDLGSANGILIGDVAVSSAVLPPDGTVLLGDSLIRIHDKRDPSSLTQPPTVLFNRPPRIQPRYTGQAFRLPEPPSKTKGQRFPIIPLFAPLLMGAALYETTRSPTSLIFMGMSPLMMLGNVLEGQLAGKRTYQRDLVEFTRAIDDTRAELAAEAEREVVMRREEHPSLAECSAAVRSRGPLLWSRRRDQDGFGAVRLGLGRQQSRNKLEYPFQRQSEPEHFKRLHEEFDSLTTIEGAPVVALLSEGGLGIACSELARSRDVARSYLMQLAALHSYVELAICAICGSGSEQWEWLKWLPHCGSDHSPVTSSPLAAAQPDVSRLVGELEALLRSRAEASRGSQGDSFPTVLLLVDSPADSDRSRVIELAERGPAVGIWVIWIADSAADLPAACKTFVTGSVEAEGCDANFVDDAEQVRLDEIDMLSRGDADRLARLLSPIADASSRSDIASDVPRSVSMLALVGEDLAADPEQVIDRWISNRSVLTGPRATTSTGRSRAGNLRAIIGESASGPHALDLRVHGPHALVGGTTGAGKSEMLQSWIIGMALSNSPQRLTFLLVDYKGGSAFRECVNLPHTVGLVTDLSPHLVRRALTSLSAELRYREQILHRKRAKDLVALERSEDPDAPPSLVIVVDEFAALVREVPEFVDGVVNVAQRGRSLGLHLILATQRPAGVIRDNLRANTNLRIALRMADANDSADVIGSKVAASFDPAIPGRAASRTGPTALIPFQTAYVGGWTAGEPGPPDIEVSTWGFAPKVRWEPPLDESRSENPSGPTDIQRLVATMSSASQLTEIPSPRKPWLPELEHVYDLAELETARRDDEIVFAIADDPANQRQYPVAFHPDQDGNMAVFGTGNSGKSTLLRTLGIAAGFSVRGGPVQVYGLDFGARGLQILEQLPHVGSIISGTDMERVARLLGMIKGNIDARAAEYASVGAGSISQFRSISGRSDEPRILLLVDGMGAMRTAYEGTEHHRLFELFQSIAADGRQVGVHVVLTADRGGALPSALTSLIQKRVILRLANDNDYGMLGAPNDVLDSKSPPGRGIFDDLEIQVAVFGSSPDLLSQDLAARALAASMVRAGAQPAPPIGKLDEEVWLDEIAPTSEGCPTFALAADTLGPKSFPTSGTFTVAGPPGSGRTTTLLTMAAALRRVYPDAPLALFGSRRSPLVSAIAWDHVALDLSEASVLAAELPELLGETGGNRPPAMVVIESLVDFVQSAADPVMTSMIKTVTNNGHLVVSEGEPTPLGGLAQLLQVARASRIGIVLQPEQTDATLFRTQFPRVRKADFPPGRGLFVGRGATPVTVQVARLRDDERLS